MPNKKTRRITTSVTYKGNERNDKQNQQNQAWTTAHLVRWTHRFGIIWKEIIMGQKLPNICCEYYWLENNGHCNLKNCTCIKLDGNYCKEQKVYKKPPPPPPPPPPPYPEFQMSINIKKKWSLTVRLTHADKNNKTKGIQNDHKELKNGWNFNSSRRWGEAAG